MDLGLDTVVQEIANIGFTIFCFVLGGFIIHWLDRNVFNKNRRRK